MGVGATRSSRPTWIALVVGAAIGLALGVVVSIATDIPLAPEVGLLIGVFVAWRLRRKRT
jgi:membrane associated rhomboid family serine protease